VRIANEGWKGGLVSGEGEASGNSKSIKNRVHRSTIWSIIDDSVFDRGNTGDIVTCLSMGKGKELPPGLISNSIGGWLG